MIHEFGIFVDLAYHDFEDVASFEREIVCKFISFTIILLSKHKTTLCQLGDVGT